MPRRQPRNSFWYFMNDWKMRQEREGRIFPNGFRDVQADPACSEAWQALAPEQKLVFATKAKEGKYQKGQSTSKQTSIGESIQSIRDSIREEEDFKLNMEAHIRHTVYDAKKYNALPTTRFYFMHMNYYYMRIPDLGPVDYCPAEFAIAEFSLEEGVTRYYHEIIKAPPHLGYLGEALQISEKTHRLHWDLPMAVDNWAMMYTTVMDFLAPGFVNDKPPPVYTREKQVDEIPSLLRRMAGAVGKPVDMFLLYKIESLFGHILRATSDYADSNVLNVIAQSHFEKELFSFTPNIECDFHKTHDNTGQYCSLSKVRQWGFTICDQCCRPLGVTMMPGIHCPEPPETFLNQTLDSSLCSFSDHNVSVLSATGVSNAHRISVSERTYAEEVRRRRHAEPIEVIRHGSRPSNGRPLPRAPSPPRLPRCGNTASQAVSGICRDLPKFNNHDFPPIGGRGVPVKPATPSNRQVGSVWAHRG